MWNVTRLGRRWVSPRLKLITVGSMSAVLAGQVRPRIVSGVPRALIPHSRPATARASASSFCGLDRKISAAAASENHEAPTRIGAHHPESHQDPSSSVLGTQEPTARRRLLRTD